MVERLARLLPREDAHFPDWQLVYAFEPNLEPLRRLLRETFPNERIEVRATRDAMALVGRASSQAVARPEIPEPITATRLGAVGLGPSPVGGTRRRVETFMFCPGQAAYLFERSKSAGRNLSRSSGLSLYN